MYDTGQPVAASSTSQLYRLPMIQSDDTRCGNSFQDKGKKREEISTSIESVSRALEHGQASNSTILGGCTSSSFSRRSRQRQCPHLSPSLSSAESDDSQSPIKQSPLDQFSSSELFKSSPLYNGPMAQEAVDTGAEFSEANQGGHSAYEDHSGPKSYSASDEILNSSHTAAGKQVTSLGLRRRPYQAGIRPFDSQSSDSETLSRIDRESIFSGLHLDTKEDKTNTTSAPGLESAEAMNSSSIKRSFEEAISPSRSPRAGGSSSHGRVQDNQEDESSSAPSSSSRAFSTSVSHPVVSLRNNDHTGLLIGSSDLQSARRRIPYKRRRAASLEATSEMEACLHSISSGDGIHRALPSAQRKAKDVSRASHVAPSLGEGSRRDHPGDHHRPPRMDSRERANALRLPRLERIADIDTTMDNADVASGTSNLLQRWWVDTEAPAEVMPGNTEDLSFGASAEEGAPRAGQGRSEASGLSSALSSTRLYPASATQSVLRHLQLQESSESDDINITSNSTAPSHGMQYHDQLMDVFRRLNEGTPGRATEMSRPSMLPRSAPMHRSNTQLSDTRRGSGSNENSLYMPTRFGRDAEDTLSAYSSIQLPSARTHEMQASSVNQGRVIPAMDSYAELTRRNEEVLSRYQNGPFSSRLRHSGSPTFPNSIGQSSSDDVYPWHIGTASRSLSDAMVSSQRNGGVNPDYPLPSWSSFEVEAPTRQSLWGELPRSRALIEDRSLHSANDVDVPFDSFDFLFPNFGNRSGNDSQVASLLERRERFGPSGDSNRPEIDLEDFMRRGREETLRANRASRLHDEAMVMRTYRNMEFPDPEATLHPSSEVSQLPRLRSPSPLISSFEHAASGLDERSNGSQEGWSRGSRFDPPASTQSSRPSLRPLTLASRLAERSEGASTSPTVHGEHGGLGEILRAEASRHWRSLSTREGQRRDGESHHQSHDADHRGRFGTRAGDRSLQRRNEEDRRRPLEEAAALLPRRFTLNSEHSRQMRHEIAAASSTGRRANRLGEEANAIDMERSSRLRDGRSLVPHSNNAGVIGRPRGAMEAARSTRPYLPFTRFGPRMSGRYDRYLDEMGSSSSGRDAAHHQLEGPISSSSSNSLASMLSSSSSTAPSLFNLSRLPSGSQFANSLRSEIAMNPGNYVADDDFALRDTYEGLLQLSAQIGDVRCRSTPSYVIDKLPTCLYDDWLGGNCSKEIKGEQELPTNKLTSSTVINKGKAKAKEDTEYLIKLRNGRGTTCSICLESYQASEMIMSLPCDHAFHATCVTTWLKTARSCPCCRGNVCSEDANEKGKHPMLSSFGSVPWHQLLPELNF